MKRFVSTFVAVALCVASNLAAGQPTTQEAADSIKQAAASNPDEPHRMIYSGARQELELNPNEPVTLTLSTTQPTKLNLSTTRPGQEFNLEFAKPQQPILWNTRDIVGADGQLVGVEAYSAAGKADEAYMGVGVDAPDATLRAQLSLPADSGLIVSYLDDQGPAKSSVQLHDILQKFDDQLLMNAEQLAALVRMHKPGDKVSITLVRQAKSVAVQMELGQRKTSADNRESGGVLKPQSNAGSLATGPTAPGAALPLPNGNTSYAMMLDQNRKLPFWNGDSRVETFDDGEILVILSPNGNLQAINAKTGEGLFQGPIRNQQQWDAIPAKVKERVATWRDMIQTADPATQPSSSKQ